MPGEFHAAVFGRVVAGSDVDAAAGVAIPDVPGDGGRGTIAVGEQRLDAVTRDDFGGGNRKLVPEKSRVVSDDDERFGARRGMLRHVTTDGICATANVVEGDFFTDDAAPA